MKVNAYLNFNGQCEEAFKFYQECLGGTITAMSRFSETEAAEYVPAEAQQQIMHISMEIGGTTLMGSDSPHHYLKPQGLYVALHPETPEEAERIFNALSENGQVEMPLQETSWAERFGSVVDRFGTPWMLNCALQNQNA